MIVSREAQQAQRRCLVTRDAICKTQGLRFVCDVDGFLQFDVRQVLPGRGAWLQPHPRLWQRAQSRWAHALRSQLKIPSTLYQCIAPMLKQHICHLVGMLRPSYDCQLEYQPKALHDKTTLHDETKDPPQAVVDPQTNRSRNDIHSYKSGNWLWLACDASKDILEQVQWRENYVVCTTTKDELGQMFGVPSLPFIHMQDTTLSRRVHSLLYCWHKWTRNFEGMKD